MDKNNEWICEPCLKAPICDWNMEMVAVAMDWALERGHEKATEWGILHPCVVREALMAGVDPLEFFVAVM